MGVDPEHLIIEGLSIVMFFALGETFCCFGRDQGVFIHVWYK
jgi:hypothetical protein